MMVNLLLLEVEQQLGFSLDIVERQIMYDSVQTIYVLRLDEERGRLGISIPVDEHVSRTQIDLPEEFARAEAKVKYKDNDVTRRIGLIFGQ